MLLTCSPAPVGRAGDDLLGWGGFPRRHRHYTRLLMATIVGFDNAHAVPPTIVTGIGHCFLGSVDWPLLASLLTGSILGISLGSFLAARTPDAACGRY